MTLSKSASLYLTPIEIGETHGPWGMFASALGKIGDVVRVRRRGRGRINLKCPKQMHLFWEIRRVLGVDPQPSLAAIMPSEVVY